jgi:hypothetical protein
MIYLLSLGAAVYGFACAKLTMDIAIRVGRMNPRDVCGMAAPDAQLISALIGAMVSGGGTFICLTPGRPLPLMAWITVVGWSAFPLLMAAMNVVFDHGGDFVLCLIRLTWGIAVWFWTSLDGLADVVWAAFSGNADADERVLEAATRRAPVPIPAEMPTRSRTCP